ncbi:hypothetical protein WJX72_007204 [[Myrmecia] bisecta]|uniref:Holocytochrome c-type synthase n=1 Tax=[Myrmecia] bisecta TaxID=41462 RepID=A0AAW1PQ53_9CHLO
MAAANEDASKKAQRIFARAASTDTTQAQTCASGAQPSPSASSSGAGGCPVGAGRGAEASSAECPVITPDFNPKNMMPQSPNNPSPGQAKALPKERVASSILIGAPDLPGHQAGAERVWMYPSEQMFYNAMKRKGWSPSEDDMHNVVAIHNAVNERAWAEVRRWESLHRGVCGEPKLRKFVGRPQEYSPKARLLNLLGYKLPFDRHDWVVDRCGREVRYIIDFYNAAPLPGMPIAMHLDVRPALDSPSALWDRLRMQARWVNSGRWRRE